MLSSIVASLTTHFKELYQYREVLVNILSQDLKVKYKRTYLGYFWSLLNPTLQLLVLAAVFSHIVQKEIKEYTLYLFSGLLAWNFFQATVTASSTALLENENFIKKIYLPKLIFPLSKLCLKAIDFLFALVALSVIGILLGFSVKTTILLLPFAILLLFTFTFGIGLLVSVATIYFRDIQYLLTVFLQLLYFATPIMYQESLFPEKFRMVLRINPLLIIINLFHKLVYEGVIPNAMEWLSAAGLAISFLGAGLYLLNELEEDLVFRM